MTPTMGFPLLGKRIGIAATVLALTAASGCSWFEEEDLDFEANEGRLTDMYNESIRLNAELNAVEGRIVQDCLEEQGFELHDTDRLAGYQEPERDTFLDTAPYEQFLPTEEEAALRGYWQWTNLSGSEELADPELEAAHESYLTELGFPPEEELEEIPEFFYQPGEDQYAWYVAYGGDTWAAAMHSDLGGPGLKTDASGEEIHINPRPEGCLLEMVEAVYGGFTAVDNDEEGWTDWTWRPEQPKYQGVDFEEDYAERLAGDERDFLDCIDERGWGSWEFTQGYLAVNEFLYEAGEGDNPASSYTDSAGSWPDPPDEVPPADDFEGWLEFERGLALDMVACGDETGYRDAAEHAWQQEQLGLYLDIEDATYSWQEEMRAYLVNAQEVIGE
jgi:hypothetical protein